jgi:hypothetical protein
LPSLSQTLDRDASIGCRQGQQNKHDIAVVLRGGIELPQSMDDGYIALQKITLSLPAIAHCSVT